MSNVNADAQGDVRELTLDELHEIAGGFLNFSVHAKNVGIGEVNQGAISRDNINVGIGELNV